MNALVIWVILPGLAAMILYSLRRWEKAVNVAGLLIALMLAALAWQLPIGKPLSLRLWASMPTHQHFGLAAHLRRQFFVG